MNVRAKFRVEAVCTRQSGSEIKLMTVLGDNPENGKFFKFTPYGEIRLGTVTDEVARQFAPGGEVYVDFIPTTKGEPHE
jgi:hypothetical protein